MAVDQSNWKFVVTDLSGNVQGEALRATNRTYSDPLNSMRTAGFTVNIDNPVADYLMNNDCLLKVYRRPRRNPGAAFNLLMVGDVIQADETGSGGVSSVNVVAADPFWRLMKRLVGMATNANGQGTGITMGTPLALQDIGSSLYFQLAILNTTVFTGITPGSVTLSTNSAIGPLYATFFGQIVQDACASLGGPDFTMIPQEPSGGSAPNTIIATMNFMPTRGTAISAAFEYGTGQNNLASYGRLLSRQGLANLVYALPQGWPSAIARNDAPVVSSDLAIAGTTNLYEDIVSSDVVSTVLRQAVCDEALAIRKVRRQQITITPKTDFNLDYGVDFNTGDVAKIRIFQNGTYRVNGTARIYSISFNIDDEDAETITLTLVP